MYWLFAKHKQLVLQQSFEYMQLCKRQVRFLAVTTLNIKNTSAVTFKSNASFTTDDGMKVVYREKNGKRSRDIKETRENEKRKII